MSASEDFSSWWAFITSTLVTTALTVINTNTHCPPGGVTGDQVRLTCPDEERVNLVGMSTDNFKWLVFVLVVITLALLGRALLSASKGQATPPQT